jgi:endonuclease YncB( thermonuclease family)
MRITSKRPAFGWAFLYLLLAQQVWAGASCGSAPVNASWQTISAVYDGDTLRTVGGEKIRLIAVNTPELARKGRPAQPLAEQARQLAQQFAAADAELAIIAGIDPRDRYGRTLAHVYSRDGRNLAAELLARGLGWQVVIPGNTGHWQCYRALEQQARVKRLGVWQQAPLNAQRLTSAHAGFAVVSGKVDKVAQSRNHWWLTVGRLAISIPKKDQHHFGAIDWHAYQGREITVKGWLIDRSNSRGVKEKGYAPLMMSVRHPAMLL